MLLDFVSKTYFSPTNKSRNESTGATYSYHILNEHVDPCGNPRPVRGHAFLVTSGLSLGSHAAIAIHSTKNKKEHYQDNHKIRPLKKLRHPGKQRRRVS